MAENATKTSAPACFFERDASLAIYRRSACEGAGTLFLVLVAASSGLMARQLVPGNPTFGVMTSAVATSGALVSLILAFGKSSGGHFNPLISGVQWLQGERKLDCTLAYVVAQIAGGCVGSLLANTMFSDSVAPVAQQSPIFRLVISEAIDSTGLMTIVLGCTRSGRLETGPFAVGAWLIAAIVATPSGCYANPAVTMAALVSNGPIHLTMSLAVYFVVAQVIGTLLALLLVTIAYPGVRLPVLQDGRNVEFGEGR